MAFRSSRNPRGRSSPMMSMAQRSIRTPRTSAPERCCAANDPCHCDRRFPLLKDAPLSQASVCQYENSSNGDFLIDLHPQWRTRPAARRWFGPRFQARSGSRSLCSGAIALLISNRPEPRFRTRVQDREYGARSISWASSQPRRALAEKPILHHIARLHFIDDRSGLSIGARDFLDCLVPVRIQRLADRFHPFDAVALEHRLQLSCGRDSIPARRSLPLSSRRSSPTAASARSR